MKQLGAPGFLCAVAAALLGWALQRSSGMFEPLSLLLATVASALALAAAVRGRLLDGVRIVGGRVPAQPAALAAEPPALYAQLVFGAGLLYSLYCHLFESPTFYGDPRLLQSFRGLALFAVILGSAYLCVHLRASLRRARFLALLAVFAVMGIAIIRASPSPHIDVWVFQQLGADALWKGLNPYSISYPDLYARTGSTLQTYGSQIVQDGRVTMYPYPPLTALLDAPVHALLGDIRYLLLGCMLLGAWALGRLEGERPEAPQTGASLGELAALFFLFQPRTFFVLEQAWTEPLVFAAFAVALLVAQRFRDRPRGFLPIGLAAGVFAASKQYTPLLLIPFALALTEGKRLRTALVALGVVIATALPFALWNPLGLYRDVVLMQFLQPMRTDSLSLLALWVRRGGVVPGGALAAFVAAGLSLAVSVKPRLSLGQAATAAAAAWLLLVLLNKQASCNYDYLGVGLLCLAAAARSGKRSLEVSSA